MQVARIFPFLFALAANLVRHAEAHACAVCLTGATGGERLANAFNWSVLFLMGAPYVVFGAIAGWLWYQRRRALRGKEETRKRLPALRLAGVNEGIGR